MPRIGARRTRTLNDRLRLLAVAGALATALLVVGVVARFRDGGPDASPSDAEAVQSQPERNLPQPSEDDSISRDAEPRRLRKSAGPTPPTQATDPPAETLQDKIDSFIHSRYNAIAAVSLSSAEAELLYRNYEEALSELARRRDEFTEGWLDGNPDTGEDIADYAASAHLVLEEMRAHEREILGPERYERMQRAALEEQNEHADDAVRTIEDYLRDLEDPE